MTGQAVRLSGGALCAEGLFELHDESPLCEPASKRSNTALGPVASMHDRSKLPRNGPGAQQAHVALFRAITGVAFHAGSTPPCNRGMQI
ncbi:MAG: hypothetical protein WD851_24420 [Pirellulales bacterium]